MSKFTSIVSSIVNNSDGSIKSGISDTFRKLSDALGDTPQKIKNLSGKNLESTLYLERFGKKILLSDILVDIKKGILDIGENLVSFGVGDIIGTSEKGSIHISIAGYTKFDISPNSKFKFSETGRNFLTYEHLGGKVKYDFTHKPGFTYKIKGKTSYATIRGTILEVESGNKNDIYHVIQGSIEVYNITTKKSIILNAPNKIII